MPDAPEAPSISREAANKAQKAAAAKEAIKQKSKAEKKQQKDQEKKFRQSASEKNRENSRKENSDKSVKKETFVHKGVRSIESGFYHLARGTRKMEATRYINWYQGAHGEIPTSSQILEGMQGKDTAYAEHVASQTKAEAHQERRQAYKELQIQTKNRGLESAVAKKITDQPAETQKEVLDLIDKVSKLKKGEKPDKLLDEIRGKLSIKEGSKEDKGLDALVKRTTKDRKLAEHTQNAIEKVLSGIMKKLEAKHPKIAKALRWLGDKAEGYSKNFGIPLVVVGIGIAALHVVAPAVVIPGIVALVISGGQLGLALSTIATVPKMVMKLAATTRSVAIGSEAHVRMGAKYQTEARGVLATATGEKYREKSRARIMADRAQNHLRSVKKELYGFSVKDSNGRDVRLLDDNGNLTLPDTTKDSELQANVQKGLLTLYGRIEGGKQFENAHAGKRFAWKFDQEGISPQDKPDALNDRINALGSTIESHLTNVSAAEKQLVVDQRRAFLNTQLAHDIQIERRIIGRRLVVNVAIKGGAMSVGFAEAGRFLTTLAQTRDFGAAVASFQNPLEVFQKVNLFSRIGISAGHIDTGLVQAGVHVPTPDIQAPTGGEQIVMQHMPQATENSMLPPHFDPLKGIEDWVNKHVDVNVGPVHIGGEGTPPDIAAPTTPDTPSPTVLNAQDQLNGTHVGGPTITDARMDAAMQGNINVLDAHDQVYGPAQTHIGGPTETDANAPLGKTGTAGIDPGDRVQTGVAGLDPADRIPHGLNTDAQMDSATGDNSFIQHASSMYNESGHGFANGVHVPSNSPGLAPGERPNELGNNLQSTQPTGSGSNPPYVAGGNGSGADIPPFHNPDGSWTITEGGQEYTVTGIPQGAHIDIQSDGQGHISIWNTTDPHHWVVEGTGTVDANGHLEIFSPDGKPLFTLEGHGGNFDPSTLHGHLDTGKLEYNGDTPSHDWQHLFTEPVKVNDAGQIVSVNDPNGHWAIKLVDGHLDGSLKASDGLIGFHTSQGTFYVHSGTVIGEGVNKDIPLFDSHGNPLHNIHLTSDQLAHYEGLKPDKIENFYRENALFKQMVGNHIDANSPRAGGEGWSTADSQDRNFLNPIHQNFIDEAHRQGIQLTQGGIFADKLVLVNPHDGHVIASMHDFTGQRDLSGLTTGKGNDFDFTGHFDPKGNLIASGSTTGGGGGNENWAEGILKNLESRSAGDYLKGILAGTLPGAATAIGRNFFPRQPRGRNFAITTGGGIVTAGGAGLAARVAELGFGPLFVTNEVTYYVLNAFLRRRANAANAAANGGNGTPPRTPPPGNPLTRLITQPLAAIRNRITGRTPPPPPPPGGGPTPVYAPPLVPAGSPDENRINMQNRLVPPPGGRKDQAGKDLQEAASKIDYKQIAENAGKTPANSKEGFDEIANQLVVDGVNLDDVGKVIKNLHDKGELTTDRVEQELTRLQRDVLTKRAVSGLGAQIAGDLGISYDRKKADASVADQVGKILDQHNAGTKEIRDVSNLPPGLERRDALRALVAFGSLVGTPVTLQHMAERMKAITPGVTMSDIELLKAIGKHMRTNLNDLKGEEVNSVISPKAAGLQNVKAGQEAIRAAELWNHLNSQLIINREKPAMEGVFTAQQGKLDENNKRVRKALAKALGTGDSDSDLISGLLRNGIKHDEAESIIEGRSSYDDLQQPIIKTSLLEGGMSLDEMKALAKGGKIMASAATVDPLTSEDAVADVIAQTIRPTGGGPAIYDALTFRKAVEDAQAKVGQGNEVHASEVVQELAIPPMQDEFKDYAEDALKAVAGKLKISGANTMNKATAQNALARKLAGYGMNEGDIHTLLSGLNSSATEDELLEQLEPGIAEKIMTGYGNLATNGDVQTAFNASDANGVYKAIAEQGIDLDELRKAARKSKQGGTYKADLFLNNLKDARANGIVEKEFGSLTEDEIKSLAGVQQTASVDDAKKTLIGMIKRLPQDKMQETFEKLEARTVKTTGEAAKILKPLVMGAEVETVLTDNSLDASKLIGALPGITTHGAGHEIEDIVAYLDQFDFPIGALKQHVIDGMQKKGLSISESMLAKELQEPLIQTLLEKKGQYLLLSFSPAIGAHSQLQPHELAPKLAGRRNKSGHEITASMILDEIQKHPTDPNAVVTALDL